MKVPLVCLVLILAGTTIAQDTTKYPTEIYVGPAAPQGMTMSDVIKLTRAGVKEDVIIQQLRAEGKTFRLTSNDLIRLKNAGVSDRVVQAMITPAPASLVFRKGQEQSRLRWKDDVVAWTKHVAESA